ncbi:cytoplasmic dynein 2 heavy chain 1-like [Haemaphysalis longicornis]
MIVRLAHDALERHWGTLGSVSLDECAEWLDTGLAILDERSPVTPSDSLREALGRGLNGHIQRLLSDLDPWRAPAGQLEQQLGQALAASRPPLSDRLRALLEARRAQEQLLRLADHQDPLPAAPSLSDPEDLWQAALSRHAQWTAPLAAQSATVFAERIRSCTSALPLLEEFKTHMEVLRHPQVQAKLAPERETILRVLGDVVDEVSPGGRSLQGVPDVVHEIAALQDLAARLEDAQQVVRLLGKGDEASWEKLAQRLRRARDEARETAADRIDSWGRTAQLLARTTNEAALVVDAGGRPRVSLSPRLAATASEARQLRSLGFRLPPPVRPVEDQAASLGRRARHLQQVASFYASVADQMVASQRALMLGPAEELTRALRQRVPWTDLEALDALVARLRTLVSQLAALNRRLRALHLAVGQKVVSLFELDLLADQQGWKQVLVDIRAIMTQQQGSPDQVRPWRAHWDRQLYKVLECQYLRGLETLLQHLPETRLELTCRGGQLCFRPPLEEVRLRYYQYIKRFLSLPLHFRGVSDDLAADESLIFSLIAERDAHRFVQLYRRTQRLFVSVQSAAERFEEWAALGSLDLGAFTQNLSVEEWKSSLRSVKSKGQEFGRAFPAEERFECLTLSYAPVRSYVDFALSELESGLVRELRASAARDAAAVRAYLDDSLAALSGPPAQSADQLTQLTAAFGRALAGRDEAAALHASARDKQQLLGRWSRAAEGDGHLQELWDALDERLSQQRDVVAHQLEVLKRNAAARLDNFELARERFVSRWENVRSRLAGDDAPSLLRELEAEMNTLLKARRDLVSEAQQLGLAEPDTFGAIEEQLQEAQAAWSLRQKFDTDLRSFTELQWTLAREKLGPLEEFLDEWTRTAKDPATPAAVAATLYKEIDAYRVALSVLPLCRGEAFSAQHWAELLQLADAAPPKDGELQLSHLVAAAPRLAAKIPQLQELNSRARAEANMRAILSELDIWASTARFSLLKHTDSAGADLMIIQEWAQVLGKRPASQVGELQLLVRTLSEACRGLGGGSSLADGAALWQERLERLEPALRSLQRVQQLWLQLEPLLGAPRALLPDQAAAFENTSRRFRLAG